MHSCRINSNPGESTKHKSQGNFHQDYHQGGDEIKQTGEEIEDDSKDDQKEEVNQAQVRRGSHFPLGLKDQGLCAREIIAYALGIAFCNFQGKVIDVSSAADVLKGDDTACEDEKGFCARKDM